MEFLNMTFQFVYPPRDEIFIVLCQLAEPARHPLAFPPTRDTTCLGRQCALYIIDKSCALDEHLDLCMLYDFLVRVAHDGNEEIHQYETSEEYEDKEEEPHGIVRMDNYCVKL